MLFRVDETAKGKRRVLRTMYGVPTARNTMEAVSPGQALSRCGNCPVVASNYHLAAVGILAILSARKRERERVREKNKPLVPALWQSSLLPLTGQGRGE